MLVSIYSNHFQQYSILLFPKENTLHILPPHLSSNIPYLLLRQFNFNNPKLLRLISLYQSSLILLKQFDLYMCKYNNFCQQTMRINGKIIVKKSCYQNKKEQQDKGYKNKQQSLNINNIRESGYKIIRSKSNRSQHSLSTKKPLRFNHSSNKYLSNKQPATPLSFNSRKKSKQYLASEVRVSNNNNKTLIKYRQHNKTLDCEVQKDMNETFTYQRESLFNSTHKDIYNSQEIMCIKNIWDNIKILKQKQFFISSIIQLEKIIQEILVKIAEDSNNPTQRTPLPTQIKEWKTITIKKEQIQLQKKMLDSFKTKKLQKISMSQEFKKQSYKSSFQSFKIENEQSHKYEFLNLYEQSQLKGKSQGLSNLPSRHNILFNNKSSNESMKANNDSSNNSDRLYLKNIIKKNKKTSGTQSKTNEKPINEGICNTICNKQNKDIVTFSCGIFDCDASKKQSSGGSSESKRQVLNQIISMLNYKYQKNIKIEFNKVII